VNSYANWRKTWSIIIPCNITGSQYADLLFYDRAAGVGEFYSTDGKGNLTLLSSQSTWRTSWTEIHAIGFTELMFYDATAGVGEFYTTDIHGNMTLLKSYTDWRKTWHLIAPGNFS
jgi:hypothetical protein